jgi:diacylglycerol kinase
MKAKEPFSIRKRLKSFGYAFRGLKILIREEHNARVQLGAAVLVIVAGFIFHLTAMEWVAILFSIGFVVVTETVNSALEHLCDYVMPEKHEQIKKVKDLAAAAVLLASIVAAAVGILVFGSKLW